MAWLDLASRTVPVVGGSSGIRNPACSASGPRTFRLAKVWNHPEHAARVAATFNKGLRRAEGIGTAASLLAPPPAGYLTGHKLVIDGGLSL